MQFLKDGVQTGLCEKNRFRPETVVVVFSHQFLVTTEPKD